MLYKRLNINRLFVIFLAGAGVLAGCGPSDFSSEAGGSVQLLLTDGPTDEFDQVNISVDTIALLGEGESVYLLAETTSYNLLDLRNCAAMLAVQHDVPVGTYSKLRLDISNIELVKFKADGSVEQTIVPKLASGRIELNPKSQFAVAAGERLVIELDMDAEKSIQITTSGKEKYVFHPQVFVEVISDATALLIRLTGKALNVQDDSFQLCRQGMILADTSCAQINIVSGTVVMSSDIAIASYADVSEGDDVLVFGHLDSTTDAINAVRVFDDTTELSTFKGEFSGAVVADAIDFSITKDAVGVSSGEMLPMRPMSPAAVYDNQGKSLTANAIADGISADVIGLLLPDSITPGEIRPGMIIIPVP